MAGRQQRAHQAGKGIHIPGSGKLPNSPNKDPGVHYYPPGLVASEFLQDRSFISGIMGPFGSGKSTAVVMKLMMNARMQRRALDGWIYRRTAIIRNTYPELRTTTMKTWHQWMPQHIGKWREAGPPTHHIINEREKVNWEVIFLALDRPDDISKLLSIEFSDAWCNEAREMPKPVLDALTGRVGRYPSHAIVPCDNAQILMDTNPPDSSHWWYVLAEQDQTTETNRQIIQSMLDAQTELRMVGVLREDQVLFNFHKQPGGRAPNAENVKNLRPGYYTILSAGKTADFIKVYVDGEYGFIMDGKPIYPEYVDSTHSASFEVVRGIPLRLGYDWGLTPAASIGQRLPNGQWLIHDEFVSTRLGVKSFAEELKRFLAEKYSGHQIISGRGDPSGDTVTPEETTCFKIMTAAGLPAIPAPTNDPTRRKEGVKFLLTTMIDGAPGIRVHHRCSYLRKGFAGGYHFRRLQVAGEEKYRETPEKNIYSHVMEALEYDVVSAGEDRNVTVHPSIMQNQQRTAHAVADYDMFGG